LYLRKDVMDEMYAAGITADKQREFVNEAVKEKLEREKDDKILLQKG